MTEDQMRDLFREMRDQPVPPDSLRRVRLTVAARIRPRTLRRWYAAAALAGAGCIILLILSHREPASVPAPPPPVVAKEEALPAAPRPAARRPPPRMKPAPLRDSQRAAAELVIRIETPDPDVVILLIGD